MDASNPPFALKPIPLGEELEWKDVMVQRYAKITDIATFKRYSLSFLRKSVRVNTLKTTVDAVKESLGKEWDMLQVPWCKEGFWVQHRGGRLDIGNTVEHALGHIYVQEAASMIPPVVLDPQPGELVLDLCAAPGSKTTQLAQYMQNRGVLVANDITADRLASLGINLQRCGVLNNIITQMHGMRDVQFDRILLDAPCSGTGTIRKSLKTLRTWSINATRKMCTAQRHLLRDVWPMLKKGGTLVYSTCSLEPEEDEGMVSEFLGRTPDADIVPFDLNIKHGPGITSWEGVDYDPRVKDTLRIWPQDNDTEGFFIAKIVKK